MEVFIILIRRSTDADFEMKKQTKFAKWNLSLGCVTYRSDRRNSIESVCWFCRLWNNNNYNRVSFRAPWLQFARLWYERAKTCNTTNWRMHQRVHVCNLIRKLESVCVCVFLQNDSQRKQNTRRRRLKPNDSNGDTTPKPPSEPQKRYTEQTERREK